MNRSISSSSRGGFHIRPSRTCGFFRAVGLAVVTLSLALAVGCGGDDDNKGGGNGGEPTNPGGSDKPSGMYTMSGGGGGGGYYFEGDNYWEVTLCGDTWYTVDKDPKPNDGTLYTFTMSGGRLSVKVTNSNLSATSYPSTSGTPQKVDEPPCY